MILITGATGQLGKSVVEQLTKRIAANQIVAFVRDESKASVIKEKGVNLAVGNYDDVSSLDQAMRGVEKVLLISGTEQNRIQQHQNVVDAAKRAGVQLIAYTSRAVKGQDTASNPLMAGHFATEASIKSSGLNYALLRNALYMDVIPLYVGGEKVFETGIYCQQVMEGFPLRFAASWVRRLPICLWMGTPRAEFTNSRQANHGRITTLQTR